MAKNTGKDYRAKNRIRLQRHYERQAAAGKKRVSAVIPGETHELLMVEKEKTGSTISEIIEAALREKFKDSGNALQEAETVQPERGHEPAGTAAPDAPIHQDAGLEQAPAVDQGPPTQANVSDPASVSRSTSAHQEPEPIAIQDPDPQAGGGTQQTELADQSGEASDDIIPDCAGKTLKIDERDKLVRKVREALPERKDAQARVDLLNYKSVPVNTKPGLYGGKWTLKNFKNNWKWIKKRLKGK
jgi:hypothetical protein